MDRYTKVVLTVIAVALSALAIENGGISPANAANGAQKVTICDVSGSKCGFGDDYYLQTKNNDF